MPTDTVTLSVQDLAGCYFNPGPAASGLQLALDSGGRARVEKWLDLGCKWMTIGQGQFLLVGSVLITTFRDLEWGATSFATDGELHARRLRLRRAFDDSELVWRYVLAPSDTIELLDQAIAENSPGLERLDESFLGLR